MQLELEEIETKPEPGVAVQLTEDNLYDVAEWLGALSYTKRIDMKRNRTEVTFNIDGQSEARCIIGGYIVKRRNHDMERHFFYGYSETIYHEEFRPRSV